MKIQKLKEDNYFHIKHLFQGWNTNQAAIYGVIEGLLPGDVWVDKLDAPTSCLLICNDPYCFITGDVNAKIFEEYYALLKQKRNVRLQYEAQEKKDLLSYGFNLIPRREYKYIDEHVPLYENKTKYSLKRIDTTAMFELCLWKDLILDIYKNAQNYLKNGFGFILWDEEKQLVVSEAHGICSTKWLEVAAVTHENYRGQGLSTIVCNHLIHHAIQHNMRPVWGCNETNIASYKVAEHQGMHMVARYNFYSLIIT